MEKVNQEPVIDYEAAITAAQSLHGYRQGTGACVAFAKGAEWQARKASAAPQVVQPLTDCRTCAKFVGRGDRCISLTVCIGGDKYQPTQPVQQYGIGQGRAE